MSSSLRDNILFIVLLYSASNAAIINVPDEQPTIQTGINAAVDGDTVLVHPGTYVENITFNGKNLVLGSLYLITGDTSYVSQTVIDGNQNWSVVTFNKGEDLSTILSSVTITNGLASSGGGILCVSSNPSLENIMVKGNTATEVGGGIAFYDSNPSLMNVTISGNSAFSLGGGLYCSSSNPRLENMIVTRNTAAEGGGIACYASSPSLVNVVVSNNTANSSGGGIYCDSRSSPSLMYVTISGNSGSVGGGIYCNTRSNPSLMNVTISNNKAFSGGGICSANSNPRLVNVIVWGNMATNIGGGIYCYEKSSLRLMNVTISGNTSTDVGGAIYAIKESDLNLMNTILWNNSPQEIYFDGSYDPNSITISYSDVQGGMEGIVTNNNGTIFWLKGNISEDPLFVDHNNGNYRLSDYSLCIGIGNPENAPTVDRDGNPRPNPPRSKPDIGAYENPLRGNLGVNDGVSADINWTNATHTLSANWRSSVVIGAATFEYAIGISRESYTGILDWTSAITDTFFTHSGVTLKEGETYYVYIRGMDDNSQPTDTAFSNGVTTDWTLPEIIYVYEGSESADYDFQSDKTLFVISWSGSDDASDISFYEYALGTTAGSTDIVDWTNNGTETTISITGLSLSDGTTYYASLRATDVAGNVSNVSTGDGLTIDLTPPTIGTVIDGRANDLDYTSSTTELVATWMGFGDEVSGIDDYQYAIGTSPGGTENVFWTSVGTDTNETRAGLELHNGVSYYVSVRAYDFVGNLSVVVSTDGITVDTETPMSGTVRDGLAEDLDYTTSPNTLSGNWSGFSDSLSGIAYYEYAIGSSKHGTELVEWTITDLDSFFLHENLPLVNGETYYISVRAIDQVGNTCNPVLSDGMTIDWILPIISYVYEGSMISDKDFQNNDTLFIIKWAKEDNGATLLRYEYALDTTKGGTEIVDWTDNGTNTDVTIKGLSLVEGTTYYASVRGYNNDGKVSDIYTGDGVTIDVTPPSIGIVMDGTTTDLNFAGSPTELSAIWTDFADGLSGLSHYEYAIGRNGENTNVVDWTDVGTKTSITKNGLHLANGVKYHTSIRAFDVAGNVSTTVSSDGVTVDLTSPDPGFVIDGTDKDLSYTSSDSSFTAMWGGFYDDLSGIHFYEYAIGTTSGGTEIVNWTQVSSDTTAIRKRLTLSNGTTYYVSVYATDMVGNVSDTLTSDGVTVDIESPSPGIVQDGLGKDLDWTNSATTLSGRWSVFTDEVSGVTTYEYAIGSEQGSRDLVDWTNVGLDTFFTRNDLTLDNGVTYFISVRANDAMHNISDIITSNGVSVDRYEPTIGIPWEGNPSEDLDWQPSTNMLNIYWTGNDDRDIISYDYAIATAPGDSDIVSWTNVSKQTSVSIEKLNLREGVSYFASVRASDANEIRSLIASSDGITIDVTPPVVGKIRDGTNKDIAYSNSVITASCNWSGFSDSLSGIVYYEYALGTSTGDTNVINYTHAGLAKSISVTDLNLEHGAIYYFSVRAVDAVGNITQPVSSNGFTVDIYPGPPHVQMINLEPASLIQTVGSAMIMVEFSEPLLDFTVDLASGIPGGFSYWTTYLETPPSIKIDLKGPFTVLDMLILTISNITDLAGIESDNQSLIYSTPMLADYNRDEMVDVLDLSEFIKHWTNDELSDPVTLKTYELGPLIGIAPHIVLVPDNRLDHRDLMGFTQIWNWSHQSRNVKVLATYTIGETLDVEQSGRNLILNLPEEAIVGQIFLQYNASTTDISLETDENSSERIMLSMKDASKGQILVEYGYLKDSFSKQIILDMQFPVRGNSDLSITYSLFSSDQKILSQGLKTLEVTAFPREFALYQNYPNPFDSAIPIYYDLPEDAHVTLTIYDNLGQLVKTVVNEEKEAGYYSVQWERTYDNEIPVQAGVYLYRIKAGDFIQTRKMVVLN